MIHDDIAAQAYVENFALRIFNNGAAVVENGKATKYCKHIQQTLCQITDPHGKPSSQTSDTLLAGATLLEVCKVFGDLDPEVVPNASC